jgi:hypothetical protein
MRVTLAALANFNEDERMLLTKWVSHLGDDAVLGTGSQCLHGVDCY